MDGFGDDFVPKEDGAEIDPAAEFIAREQNDLAGLDDDLPAASENIPEVIATPATNGDLENDLSGNDGASIEKQSNYDIPELMNGKDEQPCSDSISELKDEGVVVHPDHFNNDLPLPSHLSVEEDADTDLDKLRREGMTPSPIPVREEPEKIKKWREEQQLRLEEKDAAEENEKEELRQKAAKELEDWYKQHEEQITKTRQANRSAEKDLVADTSRMEPGTEWERIAKLCDFNPKTAKCSRDISRMRSIILQVKQNPPVKA